MGSKPQARQDQRSQNKGPLPNDATSNQIDSERDAYVRLLADFENYRRNAESRLQSSRQRGEDDMLQQLIPAIADLEQAVQTKTHDAEALRHGVDLALRKLESILAGLGYERIKTKGQLMDPTLHEAIAARPAPKIHGTIIDEVTPGYRRNGRLVVAPKVVVSSGPAGPADAKGGDPR
ncbi:MAG: nucleotide exchange factor GrpE [Deltaproteobacteria bacterium]|nr:nucleotide exchange factor GrpE [Deltaproteobacteria bacterium]